MYKVKGEQPLALCVFRKIRKGTVREIFLFQKISLRNGWGGFLYPEKPGKSAFRLREKHIRDGFNVTFSLVRKSNQKVHQRSADLWTPGVRFKIPSGGFFD